MAAITICAIGPATGQTGQKHVSYDAHLSGWCQSVAEKQVVSSKIGDFRVRSGGTLSASGVRQTIFVDLGGVADVSGSGAMIYVSKGAKVTVSGERNQVFLARGGNIILQGKAILTMVEEFNLQVHKNSIECQ